MWEEHKTDKRAISIVVPVYKVESYLKKCVDSILNQTFTDFELILVDDGSPDNCPQICDEYAKKDARVKVLHKENGGLSDARNAGIEVATGEYIGFVDSDDYIAPDMYERLYKLITENNCDMAICRAVIVREQDEPVYEDSDDIRVMDKDTANYQMIYKRLFGVNAWNKLCKRELFNSIRFPKGMLYEDMATAYALIDECKRVVYSPMKKYAYLQRGGSIMNLTGYMVSTDKVQIIEEMLSYFKPKSISNKKEIEVGATRFLLEDIYKMASCGNLTKNKAYLDEFRRFYKTNKNVSKNKFLTLKEKIVLFMAVNMPGVLQAIYKR